MTNNNNLSEPDKQNNPGERLRRLIKAAQETESSVPEPSQQDSQEIARKSESDDWRQLGEQVTQSGEFVDEKAERDFENSKKTTDLIPEKVQLLTKEKSTQIRKQKIMKL